MRLVLFLFLLLTACSLQEDLNYESKSNLITVNGLLHPDSTVAVSGTRTAPYPNGNSFPSVEGAAVELYENDLLVGVMSYNSIREAYTIDYRPKENHTYRLEININGQERLSASTSIPRNSEVKACYSQFPKEGMGRLNGKLKVNTHIVRTDSTGIVWLGLSSKRFRSYMVETPPFRKVDSTIVETRILYPLYSSNAYLDPFNGYKDEGLSVYDFYLRLNAGKYLNEYEVDAASMDDSRYFSYEQLQKLPEELGLYVHVYTASQEYDRFLTNALLDYLNNNVGADIPNPFAEQIVNYSNVTGGTGVFAGYNSRTIGIHKFKCQ